MYRIYTVSALTLPADGSENSNGGLYKTRNPSLVNPIVVDPQRDEIDQGPFLLVPADFWKNMVSDSFLGRRAWCLQERFLSPAVLHFTEAQVAFECKFCNSELCETYPGGLPNSLVDAYARFKSLNLGEAGRRLRERPQHNKDRHDDEAGDRSLDTVCIWSRLVEKYARTNISKDADRLVAIYGLASFFSFMSEYTYIGGLLWEILPSQLMWTVDIGYRAYIINADGVPRNSATPPATRPDRRNAPSWSWASVKGPIIMPKPLLDGSLVKIMASGEQGTDFGYHDNIGLVVSGSLHPGFLVWSKHSDKWLLQMRRCGIGQDHWSKMKSKNWLPDGFKAFKTAKSFMTEKLRSSLSKAEIQRTESSSSVTHQPSADGDRREPSGRVFGEDTIFGLAQPDSEKELLPPDKLSTPLEVYCMPFIDTRVCGKYALHPDMGFNTKGISGLMLQVPDRDFQGLYQRVGVFDLLRCESSYLKVDPPSGPSKNMFRPQGGGRILVSSTGVDTSGYKDIRWTIMLM